MYFAFNYFFYKAISFKNMKLHTYQCDRIENM